MKREINELQAIVNDYSKRFNEMNDTDFSEKPSPHKWSKKEVLGHLIDSAQNNLRRFICSQYESEPPFVVYQQDFWVASNQYQKSKKEDVISLWRLMNLRICSVLDQMPPENYSRQCHTGELHTLEWLAGDYIKHLKHHINQIISGSFDVIYK